MKKQQRFGFTLVELLVVISIIGMLAGLLLPAVNAAREAGRRAVCMNNQSQLALACINYDNAKGSLPPLRGEIGNNGTNSNVTSWIGFLLAYLEYNQLYTNLTNVRVDATGATLGYENQLIRIKSLLCPSADTPELSSGTHYICNGGYQNAYHTTWSANYAAASMAVAATPTWSTRPFDPGKVSDAVFFDYRAGTNEQAATTDPTYACKTKTSIDYISSHSGTGNVILLSENERQINGTLNTAGGRPHGAVWAYWNAGTGSPLVDSDGEENVAFCYPINANDYSTLALINPTTGAPQSLVSDNGTTGNHIGYNIPNTTTEQNYLAPLFINQGRGNDTTITYGTYRRARPGSNHPGIVLAAFADRSVRPLNENMNKQTFVWICQPNSGQVIGGDAF